MKAAERVLPGSGGTRYLLRDLFTTAQSAPLASPRTCEPGPRTLTLVAQASGTQPSISGGKYLSPRPSSITGTDKLGFYSTSSYVRQNGLMVYTVVQTSLMAGGFVPAAFLTTAGLPATLASLGPIFVSQATGIKLGSSAVIVSGSLTTNTDYQVAVIARGNGYLYLIRGGTQFPNWTLLWVDEVGIDPVLYAIHQSYDNDVKVDTYDVLQKSGALARDYGKCVLYSPTVTASTVYTGSADGIDYITWTPGAGETLSYYFRWADDSNTYRLDCSQAGGTIKLYRRVAGVDTELAAGQTQTWTAGTPVRIGVIHAAGVIRTFTRIRGGNKAAKHVVTGETFNLTATGAKASGFAAAANLELWPLTFSGTDELSLA